MATTYASIAPSSIGGRSVRATYTALTETGTPPSAATDGINIDAAGALVVVAHAPTGQTFSGAGTYAAYYYDDQGPAGTGVWARFPALDLSSPTASQAAVAYTVTAALPTRGRLTWLPSGITVSGGTTTYLNMLATDAVSGASI